MKFEPTWPKKRSLATAMLSLRGDPSVSVVNWFCEAGSRLGSSAVCGATCANFSIWGCAGGARSVPSSATVIFATALFPLTPATPLVFLETPFSPLAFFFFFSFGLPSWKRPLAQHCTLPMSRRAHVAVHSIGGSRLGRSVVRGASASAPTRRMSAMRASPASWRRPPARYFRQTSESTSWPQITRMPSAKDRTRKPNRVPARWRHRTSCPPARRKVKACSLFPLLRWLPARRASLHSEARRLDERSPQSAPAPSNRRVRHATSTKLLSITRCLCPAATGTAAWRLSNSVAVLAPAWYAYNNDDLPFYILHCAAMFWVVLCREICNERVVYL